MQIPLSEWKGDKEKERQNRVWDKLLEKHGAYVLEEKMRRMPVKEGELINSYKSYNRRYPLDSRKTIVSLDLIQDYMPDSRADLAHAYAVKEQYDEFIASLTRRQKFVIDRTIEGYKPREIASMQGEGESSKVRWHLFVSRNKLR